MNQTLEETEMMRRFREAFPHEADYYQAVGFFRASGLSDSQAHALAEEAVRGIL